MRFSSNRIYSIKAKPRGEVYQSGALSELSMNLPRSEDFFKAPFSFMEASYRNDNSFQEQFSHKIGSLQPNQEPDPSIAGVRRALTSPGE